MPDQPQPQLRPQRHDTPDHARAHPQTDGPQTERPRIDRPDDDQPENNQPENDQPDNDQPENVTDGSDQPENVTDGSDDAGTAGTERARGMGAFLVEAHAWLRDELRALVAQVDVIIETGDATTGLQPVETDGDRALRTHCLAFCTALERHHGGEELGAFPMLADAYPWLAPVLARLRAEHVVVARLQREIRALVEAYEPGRSDPGALRSRLVTLAGRLEEHFAYEERTLVDALDASMPAPPTG